LGYQPGQVTVRTPVSITVFTALLCYSDHPTWLCDRHCCFPFGRSG
jgi:hypothetical protein